MRTTRLSLIQDIQQSTESERWNEFANDYGKWMRDWLVAHGVSPSDADDVEQEVMATLLVELPKFQHNHRPGAFRNWLRRIMVNRLHRLWKKKKSKHAETGLSTLIENLEQPSARMTVAWNAQHDAFMIRKLLDRAESRFGQTAVDIFRELSLQDLPVKLVAEKHDKSVGTARVIQHRVLKYLKEIGAGILES